MDDDFKLSLKVWGWIIITPLALLGAVTLSMIIKMELLT